MIRFMYGIAFFMFSGVFCRCALYSSYVSCLNVLPPGLKTMAIYLGFSLRMSTGKYPDYKTVSTGKSGFAETVKVEYDPEQISLEKLLELFFKTIDPTGVNRQGNDMGPQYRTGIYYSDKADEAGIKASIARLASAYSRPIAVEYKALENYYTAEDYY